jgi:hypothetical protein
VFVCSGDFSSLNWGSIPVVVVLTSLKLLLAVAISLVINNWWTFGDGGGNHLIDSCSNPTPGYCHSYCNDVVVIDVEFTTDDFTLVVVDNAVLVENQTSHENNNPYCIAEFRSNCAYRYWLVFKLVPIVFHVAGFLLQLVTWWYYKDFVPQQKQYDVLIAHLYPECASEQLQEGSAAAVDYPEIFRGLLERPYTSVFGLLEVTTLLYVWAELWNPYIFCGHGRPVSMFYYPLAMSLLELTKFNFYVSTRLYEQKQYDKALFALLNIEMMVTNAWVTTSLAIIFLGGVLYDWYLRVRWLLQLSVYKLYGERAPWLPEWAEKSKDPPPLVGTGSTAVVSVEMNPMAMMICENGDQDVLHGDEPAGVAP